MANFDPTVPLYLPPPLLPLAILRPFSSARGHHRARGAPLLDLSLAPPCDVDSSTTVTFNLCYISLRPLALPLPSPSPRRAVRSRRRRETTAVHDDMRCTTTRMMTTKTKTCNRAAAAFPKRRNVTSLAGSSRHALFLSFSLPPYLSPSLSFPLPASFYFEIRLRVMNSEIT